MAGICEACKTTITVSQKRIKCAQCTHLYHSDCVGFSNDLSRSQWKCPLCVANSRKVGDNSNTPVRTASKTASNKDGVTATRLDPPPAAPSSSAQTRSTSPTPTAALPPALAPPAQAIDDTNLISRISSMMDSKLSLLKSEIINDLKNTLVTEFRKEIAAVTAKYDHLEESHLKLLDEHESLMKDFVTLQNKMLQTEEKLSELHGQFSKQQQKARLFNIEVVGLPETSNESPVELIMKIANHAGVQLQPDQIQSAHRVQPMRKVEGRPKAIVATLQSRMLKDKIIAGLRKSRGISTRNLNLGGPDRKFFVNEHLTPENKQLFNAVKIRAKERSYKFTWIRNCNIFLRKNEESPVITITTEKDLQKIT
ncbi:unnamed protein product [Euphydryas editha]|uniref:Zinc finger PHD-type domain-containing protein n=1 Tax=Euphydryas editha TaxID=104508 RepID=A0AAU9U8B6_EUPED|nr:unnamed protein product [Euphydryas editha]